MIILNGDILWEVGDKEMILIIKFRDKLWDCILFIFLCNNKLLSVGLRKVIESYYLWNGIFC